MKRSPFCVSPERRIQSAAISMLNYILEIDTRFVLHFANITKVAVHDPIFQYEDAAQPWTNMEYRGSAVSSLVLTAQCCSKCLAHSYLTKGHCCGRAVNQPLFQRTDSNLVFKITSLILVFYKRVNIVNMCHNVTYTCYLFNTIPKRPFYLYGSFIASWENVDWFPCASEVQNLLRTF